MPNTKNQQSPEKQHSGQIQQKILLVGKEQLELVGVKKVDDFAPDRIYLQTALGDFMIKGDGLHIAELLPDEEKLSVTGNIFSMEFVEGDRQKSGRKKGAGIFNRLTR